VTTTNGWWVAQRAAAGVIAGLFAGLVLGVAGLAIVAVSNPHDANGGPGEARHTPACETNVGRSGAEARGPEHRMGRGPCGGPELGPGPGHRGGPGAPPRA
jgi:hypothetical protein